MKKSLALALLGSLFFGIILSGCSPVEEPPPPPASSTPQPKPPSSTPKPSATATEIPTPTPLPGALVFPLDSFDEGIPWLPYDPAKVPLVYFTFFNLTKPPFDYVLVRQAFAAAIDRDVLVEITEKYFLPEVSDPRPATNLTPPEILGRDLYHEVGIPFDPERAQELFEKAGYMDSSEFPPVTFLVNVSNATAPGIHFVIAKAMADMWKVHLGVDVTVEITNWGLFKERLSSNPPDMFRLGWAADLNDPDNFLKEIFSSGSDYNYGSYSNIEFDELVLRAREISDPAERQILYIEAERILCETDPAIIPIYHGFSDLSQ